MPSTRATSQHASTFYWRSCVSQRHVDEAAEFLLNCLKGPNRHTNVYEEARHFGLFKDRLEAAEGGLLKADWVRRISRYPQVEMYEIRWQDVAVREQNPVSGILGESFDVPVRLYYIERAEHAWMLGLHGHEKLVTGSDQEIADAQNAEIDQAMTVLRQGLNDCCGVAALQKGNAFDGFSIDDGV